MTTFPETNSVAFRKVTNHISTKIISSAAHAMHELGNVIPRIIWTMAMSPNNGVSILFSKIDLKDGYWRMCVSEEDAWNFAYVLPQEHLDEEIYLVIPDALQMGWCESPAFFCAATETARDVAENYHATNAILPEHPNEKNSSQYRLEEITNSQERTR